MLLSQWSASNAKISCNPPLIFNYATLNYEYSTPSYTATETAVTSKSANVKMACGIQAHQYPASALQTWNDERGDALHDVDFKSLSKNKLRKRKYLNQIDLNCKIFFKFFNKTSNKEALEKILSDYGEVVHLRVPYSRRKKRNLGYGYAIFATPDSVEKVLSVKDGIIIDGKTVCFHRFDNSKYEGIEEDNLVASRDETDTAPLKEAAEKAKDHEIPVQSRKEHSNPTCLHEPQKLCRQFIKGKSDVDDKLTGYFSAHSSSNDANDDHSDDCRYETEESYEIKPTSRNYFQQTCRENYLGMGRVESLGEEENIRFNPSRNHQQAAGAKKRNFAVISNSRSCHGGMMSSRPASGTVHNHWTCFRSRVR